MLSSVPPYGEEIAAPRFDYQHVESVQAFQEFFTMPMGMNTARGVKTARDTNMHNAGQLPEGNTFLITGIRVLFIPDYLQHRGRAAEDEQDAKRMLLGGQLRLRIGCRDYLDDGPLAKFPSLMPKTWMGELAYLTPDAEEAHWQLLYDPVPERLARVLSYQLVPVFIAPNQFFCVQVLAEPQPLNAPGKLGVILDGRLIRQAQ